MDFNQIDFGQMAFDVKLDAFLSDIQSIYEKRTPGEYTDHDLEQIELAAHRIIALVTKKIIADQINELP